MIEKKVHRVQAFAQMRTERRRGVESAKRAKACGVVDFGSARYSARDVNECVDKQGGTANSFALEGEGIFLFHLNGQCKFAADGFDVERTKVLEFERRRAYSDGLEFPRLTSAATGNRRADRLIIRRHEFQNFRVGFGDEVPFIAGRSIRFERDDDGLIRRGVDWLAVRVRVELNHIRFT